MDSNLILLTADRVNSLNFVCMCKWFDWMTVQLNNSHDFPWSSGVAHCLLKYFFGSDDAQYLRLKNINNGN